MTYLNNLSKTSGKWVNPTPVKLKANTAIKSLNLTPRREFCAIIKFIYTNYWNCGQSKGTEQMKNYAAVYKKHFT